MSEKTDIRTLLRQRRVFFDGGTGTVLQTMGLGPGELSETWSLTHPREVTQLHRAYLEAGADIIKTNTFGVNRLKYENPKELILGAMECAKQAVQDFPNAYIAYDMGPTGKLLEPYGNLSFEDAVEVFAENIRALTEIGGADLVLIETMGDSYETKAALLAVKENCDLPVFVTNVFDERGKLLTGADAAAMVAMLEGLGADAIGCNCSFGPDAMLPVLREFAKYASVPLIVNPNAGLPEETEAGYVYNIDPEYFSELMKQMAEAGATVLGGCCGTTPEYIRKMVDKLADLPFAVPVPKSYTMISSGTHGVIFGELPVLIGERINPTGKKKIKEALQTENYGLILSEGVLQEEAGAEVLDVNAGLVGIKEADVLPRLVKQLQGVTNLPLQIDTADAEAMERSLRIYNGKPLINSVNGSEKSMTAVLPLAKKYGGVVVALTMDETGIPATAEERLSIARRIVERAAEYGIAKKDIIVDPLTLTVSSDTENGAVTLEAVRLIGRELGVCTSLGLSNISFGLPDRETLNASFLLMALQNGLSAAIINPFSEALMKAYRAFLALSGKDAHCEKYLAHAAGTPDLKQTGAGATASEEMTLFQAIGRGLSDLAGKQTLRLLEERDPLELIEKEIVPALGEVGKAFEEKRLYLPQLLMSADAAGAAFAEIKKKLPSAADSSKRIVLATVRGDIHDIGKNIVKTLLENFGFYVEDLGKDVLPERVAQAAVGCRLVGLSALMTTTVPAMEETIRLVRQTAPEAKVVVGGAVLTAESAQSIGADYYAADAMETVRIAQDLFGK